MSEKIEFMETAMRANSRRAMYGIRKAGRQYFLLECEHANWEYPISEADANSIIAAMRDDFSDSEKSAACDDPVFEAISAAALGIPEKIECDAPIYLALRKHFFGVL